MGPIAVCQVGFLTAVFRNSLMTKILLISCIHILVFLILLYFQMCCKTAIYRTANMLFMCWDLFYIFIARVLPSMSHQEGL